MIEERSENIFLTTTANEYKKKKQTWKEKK